MVLWPGFDRGRSLFWQSTAALGVWAFVAALHWQNDGLWYPDASRHAANGLFWWDYLSRVPVNPLEFALAYYARYPVINPTAWPPLFYLVEGTAYRVFGVSPLVAKALVLLAVLVGTAYMIAWLRRWLGASAGWAGVLFALQPAVVVWGHAVMLNVPATVLALAALYHWRRWLEAPRSRHVYAALGLAVSAVLTYPSVAVISFVMLAWTLLAGRASLLCSPRLIAGGAAGLLPLTAWAFVQWRWAPAHRSVAVSAGEYPVWRLESWTYYPAHVLQLVSLPILVLAIAALGVRYWTRRWRREIDLHLVCFVVCYACFSAITLREVRYVLILVPSLIGLAAITMAAAVRALGAWRAASARRLLPALGLVLVVAHVGMTAAIPVRRASGFEAIAAFVRTVAPSERVFYDGFHNGIFSFYVRRDDPSFRRGVALGSKLLYTTKIQSRFGVIERVSSAADVTAVLVRECGCRYFIVERQIAKAEDDFQASRSLRAALAGPAFRLVRSFPVHGENVRDVDVYESVNPVVARSRVDLRFATLGDGVIDFRVAPIAEAPPVAATEQPAEKP